MANNTVYPFGPGGRLPSGVGIVNDRYTGGADKAWSAEQGKLLAQDLDKANANLNTENEELTDFLEITEGGAFITSTGQKWASSTRADPTTYGKLLNVAQFKGWVAKIHRVSGYGFRYAFLKDNFYEDYEIPHYCTGQTLIIVPDTDTTSVFEHTIPEDCNYIYVVVSLSGDDVKPTVYVEGEVTLETEAKNAFAAINELAGRQVTFNNVSAPVLMTPGVISTNGNLWSLNGTLNNTVIGQKYAHGYALLGLIEVRKNDTLEIDYEKMGVDDTLWKIGILELGADGKVFSVNGSSTANVPYYLEDTVVSFHEQTRFIRICLLLRDTSSYTLRDTKEIVVNFPVYHARQVELRKDFTTNKSDAITFPYIKGFTYPVIKPDIAFDVPATLTYQQPAVGFNNGYVILPEEYTPTGKGLPLIIYAHGTGGFVFTDVLNPPYYLDLLKNVAKGGYIVADCSCLSSFYYNNDMGTAKTVTDANWPEPIAWECYNKMYLYLTRMFNIDTSRVYIFGKSAGGLNTIMLPQIGSIPIKAAAGLAASIDLITNIRVMGSGANNTNPYMHRIGLTDANLGNKLSGSGDAQYLASKISRLSNFNPFWRWTVGLDREKQTLRSVADGIDTPTIEADTELQEAISAASAYVNTPFKWWHAIDDVNVPIATTRMFQKMVRNGGGFFEIREFPTGCGAHHAVDNDESAPTTSYTHRNGVTVTLPVAYAEVLDWFNMWWN